MQVPLEISYRNLEKTQAIEDLVQEKAARLEKFCDHITSCRIAIEKTHDHPKSGSPYRVRIDLRVPPNHELAVDRNPDQGTQYPPLEAVIRDAFGAAERQLKQLNEKQHDAVKYHPEQDVVAVVTQLFPEQDYGFIKSVTTGEEIYFHRNSVLNHEFDKIELGTGVQYTETTGEMGPQASTVRIVNKPGESIGKGETSVESAKGWQ
jgi:cold shock CspA family protein